ncbi:hypothetical protein PAXINDRAFT_9943 [Paxillus involutus ATCC 200175]|nr:hypothetical protein PAXINDRAFT_9942 [Paxillus involutus ATCC 200175]KIJ17088.1 hypothetical protein PAXINDRAFT_9943 [Paxillus involutus ATCC 200175]
MAAVPINISPPTAEAQWVCMTITNWLENVIKLQNPHLTSGKFLNDYSSRDGIYGSVTNVPIYPSRSCDVSSSGSGTRVLGTSGSIDLYEGRTRICTLYWNCPGGNQQNYLQAQNLNNNYVVTVGRFRDHGAIGDVSIAVQRAS